MSAPLRIGDKKKEKSDGHEEEHWRCETKKGGRLVEGRWRPDKRGAIRSRPVPPLLGAGASPLTESALFSQERLIAERREYGFSGNLTVFRSVSDRGQNSVLFATSCRLGEA